MLYCRLKTTTNALANYKGSTAPNSYECDKNCIWSQFAVLLGLEDLTGNHINKAD